jgi:glycine/D-amino acid oxidase-like deaminating enzyme
MFGTFVVEQKYYMKYLSDRLASKGVLFVQERVESIEHLSRTGRFDCVVNCTGLGAMEAAADPSMYPIRGQVLRVRLALQ